VRQTGLEVLGRESVRPVDKRRQVEIQVGAAINSLERLEFDIDDILSRLMRDEDLPVGLIHELTWARHHVYQARLSAVRVFDNIRTFGVIYLGSIRSLADAHTEMKSARAHMGDTELHIAECLSPIMIISKRESQWKHADLWSQVRSRTLEAPKIIETAIDSIITAKLTAN
jgi:hypothetical protein